MPDADTLAALTIQRELTLTKLDENAGLLRALLRATDDLRQEVERLARRLDADDR